MVHDQDKTGVELLHIFSSCVVLLQSHWSRDEELTKSLRPLNLNLNEMNVEDKHARRI